MSKKKCLPMLIAFMFLFCIVQKTQAQQIATPNQPAWIKMMNDSKVNYHEAVKAFSEFWKNKEKPTEEKEIFGDIVKNKKTELKTAKSGDAVKYRVEYKKFLNWQREVAPYVQPDGRILSMEERLELWEQEKKLRAQAQN